MKTMLVCAISIAAPMAPAAAEPRYDRKLEAAAMERVAARIGDIRGGFDSGKSAMFIHAPEATAGDAPATDGPAVFPPGLREGQTPLHSPRGQVSRIVF